MNLENNNSVEKANRKFVKNIVDVFNIDVFPLVESMGKLVDKYNEDKSVDLELLEELYAGRFDAAIEGIRNIWDDVEDFLDGEDFCDEDD